MLPAIETHELGKRFRISTSSSRTRTLREAFGQRFGKQAGRARREGASEFWAFRDVCLSVAPGEIVGLIGANGAGKSSFLKVLARITPPTFGRALIRGRVSALIEIGTGFHPELTGRENIFLSGVILGMRRTEVIEKFDEIVDFAGIGEFLDTPVKRYSSGMHVRLGFAIAAHLEPQVLLVDEILAVGDAAFQRKCLGKLNSAAEGGRTVVFVSHDMSSIQALCSRAILFHSGRLVAEGDPAEICNTYLRHTTLANENRDDRFYALNLEEIRQRSCQDFRFTSIEMDSYGNLREGPRTGDPLRIKIYYSCQRQYQSPAIWLSFRTVRGIELLRLSTMPISGFQIDSMHPNGLVILEIPSLPFVGGTYQIDIGFVRERVEWIVRVERAVTFNVRPGDPYGSGLLMDDTRGLVVVPHVWRHEESGVDE